MKGGGGRAHAWAFLRVGGDTYLRGHPKAKADIGQLEQENPCWWSSANIPVSLGKGGKGYTERHAAHGCHCWLRTWVVVAQSFPWHATKWSSSWWRHKASCSHCLGTAQDTTHAPDSTNHLGRQEMPHTPLAVQTTRQNCLNSSLA